MDTTDTIETAILIEIEKLREENESLKEENSCLKDALEAGEERI